MIGCGFLRVLTFERAYVVGIGLETLFNPIYIHRNHPSCEHRYRFEPTANTIGKPPIGSLYERQT